MPSRIMMMWTSLEERILEYDIFKNSKLLVRIKIKKNLYDCLLRSAIYFFIAYTFILFFIHIYKL